MALRRSTGYSKQKGSSSNPWLPYEEDVSGALSDDATEAFDSDTDSDHPDDPDEDGAERDKAADPKVDSEEPIDDEEELPAASLFVKRLKPQVLDLGPDMAAHPEPALVETQSLATVTPPPITYRLRIWDKMVAGRRSGVLSGLQLEAIAYACQSHEQMLADGEMRAGFALGDGTGAGKSRVLSGLIWENYLHGRKKALWFTASPFLAVSIRKDFAAVGVDRYMAVHSLGDFKKDDVLPSESTLLIVSYGQLRGKGRYEQLMRWLGKEWDGLAAFDESHKAKNKIAITFKLVKKFQVELPQARVVYCSATIATEMTHLEYMPRLGLWGAGTNFAQWQDFRKLMKEAGMAVMELVAMELKRQGRYLTRTLGFYDVEFSLLYASLDPVLAKAYEDSCTLWASLVLHLDKLPQKTRLVFWGTHQRFFKSLFVAAKVPCVLKNARQALRDGHSVVIGLQGTNEAQTKQSAADPDNKRRQKPPAKPTAVKGEAQDDEDDQDLLNGGTFTEPARQILISMLQKHWGDFPEVRDEALRDLDAIEGLPGNPLDALIQGLGGKEAVAELTGRSVQWGQGPDGTWEYLPKANDADAHEVERRAFMDGRKKVAIVSEAASVGISLHADKDVINQRKRVHFVIELAWQADRALQQLGRTHRANQVCSPRYHLVVLDRPTAEVRFACSVARRLVSLGAIHHGDKHANMASMDLKEFNIETRYAHQAMAPLLSEIRSSEADAELLEHLHGTELYACLTTLKVPRFLNRLLGIPLDWQTEVIQRFVRGLQANVRAAKMKGIYQEGIIRLIATSITRNGPDSTVEVEGGRLALVPLLVDRGMTWETALEELSAAQAGDGTRHEANGFYLPSGRGNVFLLIRQPSADETHVVFKKLSPNLGRSAGYVSEGMLQRIPHTHVGPRNIRGKVQAKQLWEALHEEKGRPCTCMYLCDKKCTDGRRVAEQVLVTGDLINLWGNIQTYSLKKKKLVRMEVTSEGGTEPHVGICVDKKVAEDLRRRFDAIRQRDEELKAIEMRRRTKHEEQEGDEEQMQSPPSGFRGAAGDEPALMPIDAKGKRRAEATAPARMEIVIQDSDDSDDSGDDDSRPAPSIKRHWAAEERKPSGGGSASAAAGNKTPVNHKKARVDSFTDTDTSRGDGSRAEADDREWLEGVLALASCIEAQDHMGGPWTEREIDILRQRAFAEDLRVKAAYNAARTTAARRGTPMDILDHFERSVRALIKVITASGGGRAG